MQRKLRVWAELPPRHSGGADSSTQTRAAPDSRAIKAAHSAALPPPMTNTSKSEFIFQIKMASVACQ
jgi:hypothetical protein